MLAGTDDIASRGTTDDDTRARIIVEVIEELRPALKRDGGDCELVGIEGNRVMVKLTGACVFCSLASATMDGIQARMVERLGEFVRLVPVAGPQNAVLRPRH